MARRRLLAAAVALALGTAIPGGHGWTVAAASTNFNLLTATSAGKSVPLRWNPCQDAITVRVNVAAARQQGVPGHTARVHAKAEAIRAVHKVAAVTGLPFQYNGTTSQVPTGSSWFDHQDDQSEVVIAYVGHGRAHSSLLSSGSWGTGGQAYTTLGATVVVGRGFVIVDADKAQGMDPGFGHGSVRGNLVLHELGHVIGLGHVSDPGQLMNPVLGSRTPNGFGPGDRAGIEQLGADRGCIEGAAEAWEGS
jgi:Matrixin